MKTILTTRDGQTIRLSEIETMRLDPDSNMSLAFHMKSGMTVFVNFDSADEMEATRLLIISSMQIPPRTYYLNDGGCLVLNNIASIVPHDTGYITITLITGYEMTMPINNLTGEEPIENLIEAIDNLAII